MKVNSHPVQTRRPASSDRLPLRPTSQDTGLVPSAHKQTQAAFQLLSTSDSRKIKPMFIYVPQNVKNVLCILLMK